MEPHKSLPKSAFLDPPSLDDSAKDYYQKARKFAFDNYRSEIDKIQQVTLESLTSEKFFNEYIWVVHATGFSAKAVGNFVPRLLSAYGPFEQLSQETFDEAFSRVRLVCNNPQKSKAVHKTAVWLMNQIKSDGWAKTVENHLSKAEYLDKLPYIGGVTKYHLARNIGHLDCVKPDLHLVRMASHWGYTSAEQMIRDMSLEFQDRLGIADLIVWYSASTFGTVSIKKAGER